MLFAACGAMAQERVDTIAAATIIERVDRSSNSTQTGLTHIDGVNINRGYAAFSSPDVLKVLQMLPGVASGTELLSNLYVHGGDGSDNLFLLDGVPIYRTGHLGGLFSAFNTDMTDEIDFYKSGFPARYGGRTSSVIDISTRDGSFTDIGGSLSIGPLDGRFQIEGPLIRERTSFNFGMRRSWADIIMYPVCKIINLKNGNDANSVMCGYSFSDINARITHNLSKGGILKANAYYGKDNFEISLEGPYGGEREEIGINWSNLLASVSWEKATEDHLLEMKLTGYLSHSGSNTSFGTYYSDSSEMFINYTNHLNDIGIKADFDLRVLYNQILRFGAEGIRHSFDTTGIGGFEFSLYAEDEIRLTEWLKMNLGLRNTLFSSNGFSWFFPEPRIALKVQAKPEFSFKASYSEMSQFSHLVASTYLDLPSNSWLPSGANMPPMRSRQFSGGFYSSFFGNLHLNLEGWWKSMYNLLEYGGFETLFPQLTDWENDFFTGNGRSYGIEADMGFDDDYFSFDILYTLSWNERYFEEIWNDWYRDRNDNRHKLTVSASWKPDDRWELYAAWNFHSGNRVTVATGYIPLVYTSQDAIEERWLYEKPYNVALPAYHRLDIGINHHKETRLGNESIWNLSIYNTYCRINPLWATVNLDIESLRFKGSGIGIVPIIPTFSYTFKF